MSAARQLDPEATVRAFADAWSQLHLDGVIDLLRHDIVYHNIPLDPLRGKARVADYLRSVGPFEECRWDIRNIASAGSQVLTERIDEMRVRGTRIVLPVMGVFTVEDGLIVAWRDYFDLASYRVQWPREAPLEA